MYPLTQLALEDILSMLCSRDLRLRSELGLGMDNLGLGIPVKLKKHHKLLFSAKEVYYQIKLLDSIRIRQVL